MIHGIINVLKPTGMSSHDVIGCLRRIYGMKKMGHAGTLDPLAAGVLPVYAGQATRLIEYGDSDVKSYHAEFALGLATDTEDSTGTVVETAAVPDLSADDVRRALASFVGDIEQAPSKYSAINVNGVKAYKLARQDVDFTLPVRHVTIHDLRAKSLTDTNRQGNNAQKLAGHADGRMTERYIRAREIDIGTPPTMPKKSG